MLHQPLRGLDSFATRLRRSTKLPQMQALYVVNEQEKIDRYAVEMAIMNMIYSRGFVECVLLTAI